MIDVNFDQKPDLACDFKTSLLEFSASDTRGRLTAEAIDGSNIDAEDDVTVIGPRRIRSIRSVSIDQFALTMRQLGSRHFFLSGRANVVSMNVQIFDAQGERVFSQSGSGNLMRLDLNSHQIQLANGVYFMLVNVIDKDGYHTQMDIMRVVLLR